MNIFDEISNLKGIGPKKAQKLKVLGIESIWDLINYYPVKYDNRTEYVDIENLKNNEKQLSRGIIIFYEQKALKKRLYLQRYRVRNGQNVCIINNFSAYKSKSEFKVGDKISFYGICKEKFGTMEFNSPEIELYGKSDTTNCIYPIYGLTRGITNEEIIKYFQLAKEYIEDNIEYLPQQIIKENKLMPLKEAIFTAHKPENVNKLKAALFRLIFDEFFVMQMNFIKIKNENQLRSGYKISNNYLEEYIDMLPFNPTNAQKRVMNEITSDIEKDIPMQRMVQGDVGSGKTIVGLYCAYCGYKENLQTAIMVPTEILARQHYNEAKKIFSNTDMNIQLLVGSQRASEKKKIYEQIKNGECNLVIGTHALIQSEVEFQKLGMAITDEQHRFGVKQRKLLYGKYEKTPHVMVMTATPIPRTLTLVLNGDLDISIIDELPAGRKPIKTMAVQNQVREKAFEFCKEELNKGRQVYIVCPLVEESEQLDIESAVELYETLSKTIFKEYKCGLLHGKMKAAEKKEIMEKYESHQLDILISTTVIEVGINVPNATVMVIVDAQRFGLSQLHQLRGRVGRGADESYCLLIYNSKSQITQQRMKVMTETTNGFIVSEKDLELRGPGEIFGMRQHGLPEFKIADITKHGEILNLSKRIAEDIYFDKIDMDSTEKINCENKITEIFNNKMKNIALN